MTVREEFEVWWAQDDFRNLDATYTVAFQAWNFAYRAGQEAMRERAAQLLELEYAPDKKSADRLKQIASHIRALPVDDASKGEV